MATVVYSLATNFPNARVNATVLADQIRAANVVALDNLNMNGDVVTLNFPVAVAGANLTALNAVVAAHQGLPYGPSVQRLISNAQQSNDTTGDVVAATLTSLPLPAGDYMVAFICEVAPTSNVASTGARAAVQVNGSDAYEQNVAAPAAALTPWSTFSGSSVATFAAGAVPVFRFVWRRLGASSNPALIRRMRLTISPAG